MKVGLGTTSLCCQSNALVPRFHVVPRSTMNSEDSIGSYFLQKCGLRGGNLGFCLREKAGHPRPVDIPFARKLILQPLWYHAVERISARGDDPASGARLMGGCLLRHYRAHNLRA